MTKARVMIAACATLLSAGTVLGLPTPQENCDKARLTAWKTYVSCVDTVVAKDAGCEPTLICPVSFDEFAAFAKCRHTYFRQWTLFQARSTLATSTCIGARLTDNGTTVTDNLSGLVWEKKTNLDSIQNLDPHDADNFYEWSNGSNNEDGNAFTTFLTFGLNTPGFAGANGWRLPTLAELQTTVLDFTCTRAGDGPTCSCGSAPCIDGSFGPTQTGFYWSATGYVPNPGSAWLVFFLNGGVFTNFKTSNGYVRAVRGGL